MAIRAILQQDRTEERRSAARKILRLAVSGARAGRQAAQVLILDISAEGLLIESRESLTVDEHFAVELPGFGSHEATVVWSSTHFYGCRFLKGLPSGAISAALLKSSPKKQVTTGDATRREDISSSFSTRLRTLRERRGLSIDELAERLRVSRQALWYWEAGQRAPRRHRIAKIAAELGVSETELLEGPAPETDAFESLRQCKLIAAVRLGVAPENVKLIIEL